MRRDSILEDEVYLDDVDLEFPVKPSGKARKRERDAKHKRNLQKLYKKSRFMVQYVNDPNSWEYGYDDDMDSDRKPYYIRNYIPKAYYKKCASRALRRYRGAIPKGSSYKKVYDVDWNVW